VRSGNVMPWIALSDLYIGDILTSGEERLYFNRPMVFRNPQPGGLVPSSDPAALTYLWQSGAVCDAVRALSEIVAARPARDAYAAQREAVLDDGVSDARLRVDPRACGGVRPGTIALAALAQPRFAR
jgi:hypothetical protein